MGKFLSRIRPAGFAAVADATFLIVPPKLKAAKGLISLGFDAQNAVGIEQLFDVRFVFDLNFFHFRFSSKELLLCLHYTVLLAAIQDGC